MRRSLSIIALLVALVKVSSLHGANTTIVGDRLVLQINNRVYSQREVEIYSLVRTTLTQTLDDKQDYRLRKDTWVAALEQFKKDMLLSQEAERVRQGQAPDETKKLLDKASALLQRQNLQGYVILLDISATDVKEAVERYRKASALLGTLAHATGNDPKNNDVAAKLQEKILLQLEKAYNISFFDQAQVYVPVTPNL